MNVVIDINLATAYPKHMKRLYEALSDKRDNVHFLAGMLKGGPVPQDRDWLIARERENLHKRGLYCVGFVDVVMGDTQEEIDLGVAAYCKNIGADMFVGSEGACKAVRAVLSEAMVLRTEA